MDQRVTHERPPSFVSWVLKFFGSTTDCLKSALTRLVNICLNKVKKLIFFILFKLTFTMKIIMIIVWLCIMKHNKVKNKSTHIISQFSRAKILILILCLHLLNDVFAWLYIFVFFFTFDVSKKWFSLWIILHSWE